MALYVISGDRREHEKEQRDAAIPQPSHSSSSSKKTSGYSLSKDQESLLQSVRTNNPREEEKDEAPRKPKMSDQEFFVLIRGDNREKIENAMATYDMEYTTHRDGLFRAVSGGYLEAAAAMLECPQSTYYKKPNEQDYKGHSLYSMAHCKDMRELIARQPGFDEGAIGKREKFKKKFRK